MVEVVMGWFSRDESAVDALTALRREADQRDFEKGEEHYEEDTSELARNALDSWYGTWHSGGW
jgi:hypothetical protein